MPSVCVVGWGSPYGDDRVGWEVVQALRLAVPPHPGLSLVECDRSGPALIETWEAYGAVILVDAVRSGQPVGTVHCLDARDIVPGSGGLSSHGVGVAQTVALARTLGLLPGIARAYGIEIESAGPAIGLSAPVAAAMRELIARLSSEVSVLLAG